MPLVAVARLSLQHEGDKRDNARDDNTVLAVAEDHPLVKTLDWALEEYDQAGKAERERAQTAGETFKGNPKGKKPDACLASLLQRLVEYLAQPDVEAKVTEAMGALEELSQLRGRLRLLAALRPQLAALAPQRQSRRRRQGRTPARHRRL